MMKRLKTSVTALMPCGMPMNGVGFPNVVHAIHFVVLLLLASMNLEFEFLLVNFRRQFFGFLNDRGTTRGWFT